MKPTGFRAALLALIVGTVAGCGGGGGGGDAGVAAPAVPAGPTLAAAPVPAGNAPINAGSLTADQFAALAPQVVLGAAIVGSPPQVSFALQDANGNPIIGFGGKSTRATDPNGYRYNNVSFAIARLVPGTATTGAGTTRARWVSYMVVSTTKDATTGALTQALGRPGTESIGELVDNGNGTYTYKFYRDIGQVAQLVTDATTTGTKADLDELTYDANAVHRLTIQISGNAPGTGTNTPSGADSGVAGVPMTNPVNVVYDFIPATGKAAAETDPSRAVVATANCNECHNKLNALGFHGGNRYETKYCVVCHTEQRKFGRDNATANVDATTHEVAFSGRTYRLGAGNAEDVLSNGDTAGEALGNFPNYVHKIHNGTSLSKTKYDYAGVAFNDIGYSMLDEGQRMCSKCHKNAPQAENWNMVPSKLACGACHDGINFSTGQGATLANAAAASTVGAVIAQTGHEGGAIENQAACAICHTPSAIKLVHRTENITPHNPTIDTGLVTFTYEIASADVDANNNLALKFRIMAATAPSATSTPVTFPLTGFTGGPRVARPYTMSQDGVTTPADWNNLGNTNGQPNSTNFTALTLGDPDASGYYTVTIANAYPAGAKMRAVALEGYFTQSAGTNGVAANTPRHAISVVKAVTGDAQRREVIAGSKCSKCHEWLELHGGNRVIAPETTGVVVCVVCHNPNLSTSGRAITLTQLNSNFTARANTKSIADLLTRPAWASFMTAWTAQDANASLQLPVTGNNFKDLIHGIHAGKDRTTPLADARLFNGNLTLLDFTKVGFPGILNSCETCHNAGTYMGPAANALGSTYEANNGAVASPADVAASLSTVPNTSDRVTTPFAAACVSCHDSAVAQSHMGGVQGVGGNGGQIGVLRSALLTPPGAAETCSLCHGPGGIVDVANVHK